MERTNVGDIELSWDPGTRIAILRFVRETRASGKDALALVDAILGWIGVDGKPFALLGDGNGLARVDAEYRSIWAAFFRKHRDTCSIAFFHMGPIIRVAAEMFRLGTRVPLKAFDGEAEARAWLRSRGFAA